MIIVQIDGRVVEVRGRLAAIIRALLRLTPDLSSGHVTLEVECVGRTVRPRVVRHFDPILE